MNIEQVLTEYDVLEGSHDFPKIAAFLEEKILEAKNENDVSSLITLLNEQIGFHRETGDFGRSITACRDLLYVMEEAGIKGSVPYATSLLNIANACRAAGLLKESLLYFNEVLRIYQENLDPSDYAFAPLYNNLALLFQEMTDYMSACDTLKKALGIVLAHPEMQDKIAITHTNLALSLMKNDEYDEAVSHLEEAFRIFDSFPEPDYHYGAALSAMGEALFLKGDYRGSADYYEKALAEVKKNTGFSKGYSITAANLNEALKKLRSEAEAAGTLPYTGGLELSRRYYETFGAPMIRERFPEYESRIAAGLVGEGSECEGFDDTASADHDFGPGFCLFLTDEVYDRIGKELQEAYDALPPVFLDTVRLKVHEAVKRVGVFRIGEFYENLIGLPRVPETEGEWLFIKDEQLRKAVNGEVFRDDEGVFSSIRQGLMDYYPEDVRLRKLAYEASMFSQYGQYNYPRMLKRNDLPAAMISLSGFLQSAMQVVYLLHRTYAPFYKWMHRGMKELDPYTEERILRLSGNRIDDPSNTELIDEIASHLFEELKKQGLVSANDDYLDHHTGEILSHRSGGKGEAGMNNDAMPSKEELIDTLIRLEWNAFDKTVNEGGRASCQDDWDTFLAMRKSQYLTWTEEMLLSYIDDFNAANARGWNLITEKYARMEESTAPSEYAKIKDSLPVIPPEKKAIIEEITAIQTGMMEEFAAKYPKAAMETRVIHTSEDTEYDTSYETYLRGEISTYSDRTLLLYGRFLAGIAKEGKNLAEMIIGNSALLYGYRSLEDMESKL
ncbi:MAG: DUF4125 family protein [Lachnospiraceae bacterium]|nr:DUF4125 family protein [Lachnospiraceae bacterium]